MERKLKNQKGITLVALVVTIVVLLILAGITIVYVLGDNSVFKQASEAKLKTDIAQWQERLEMAKSHVFIEGLGTFDPDKYFTYIQEQGIINNKNTDVINNEDGTYDVTTKPGYVFLVTLMPNPEKPTDAQIEYIGQAGKIAPIIKRLDVSATSSSITGKAVVARLGTNGTIKYYYKSTSADDSTYQEITNVTQETGATVSTGITAGESYTIKVVAKNDVGEVELAKEIIATKVFVESITLNKTNETIKVGSTLKLVATVKPDDATNKNVTWSSSNTNIATVSSKGVVTGKAVGTATITVKATDGSDKTATCEIKVIGITTAIDLNSVRARIATGYTRWLNAVATPSNAPQEFEWTSSNTSVATVDSTGKIIAKAVGTTTITVKTKDGTDLSKTCSVTVASGVDVTTLTSIQSSNKIARDNYGNLITVPGGFKVLTNQATSVRQGIVIQDSEGNEFVWIPVDSVSTGSSLLADDIRLGRYTFDETNGTPTKQQDAEDYPKSISVNASSFFEKTSNDGNTAAKNLGGFVTKAWANGGFYLARYEASYKDPTHCYSKKSTSTRDSKSSVLTSGMLWNYISQPDAATVARNSFNSSYIESDLVNSYAWDTTIIFIQKYSEDSKYAIKSGQSVSTQLSNTGVNNDKVCNIHDMASNVDEWTTELHRFVYPDGRKSNPCVSRGGNHYFMSTAESPVTTSRRYVGKLPDFSASYTSFRSILYLK